MNKLCIELVTQIGPGHPKPCLKLGCESGGVLPAIQVSNSAAWVAGAKIVDPQMWVYAQCEDLILFAFIAGYQVSCWGNGLHLN